MADGNQFFNRPGPRLIESIEIFAEIIHPELFNFKHEKKRDGSIFLIIKKERSVALC